MNKVEITDSKIENFSCKSTGKYHNISINNNVK